MLIKTPWGNVQLLKEILPKIYECSTDIVKMEMSEDDVFIFEREFNFETVDDFIDEFGNEIGKEEFLTKLNSGYNGELIIEGENYRTHRKFAVLNEGNIRNLSLTMKALENYYLLNNWNEEYNDNLTLQFINFSRLNIN